MKDIEFVDLACPECQTVETVITATVKVGQWERHFCECPECRISFAGEWIQLSDDTAHNVMQRRMPPTLLPQLAA